MSKITSIKGRILYNSRGSKTIEVDVESDGKFLGRVCAPSGASVGKYEAVSFPNGKPEESLRILKENYQKFIGLESSDLKSIHDTLKDLDNSENYSIIGGALAFAVTIASTESASKAAGEPLFKTLSAIDAGCDDYDTKPIVFPRLIEKIAAALGKEAAT